MKVMVIVPFYLRNSAKHPMPDHVLKQLQLRHVQPEAPSCVREKSPSGEGDSEGEKW